MSGFFYNLGRSFGQKAVPAIRRSKWIWDGLAGTDEEAFRAEVALGTELAAGLRTTVEIIEEPAATQALDDLCRQLGAHAKDKRRTFRCALFRDEFPNAMGLPGGLLYFSNSLLDLCDCQTDQMAFVAGHEMAHLLLGHTWERLMSEAALQVTSAATSRVGRLGAWLGEQGATRLRGAHARDQELKADELGFRLAMAAGLAPAGAFDFLRRVQRLEPNANGPYLASHPPAGQRFARLREVLTMLTERGSLPAK